MNKEKKKYLYDWLWKANEDISIKIKQIVETYLKIKK